MKAIDYLDTIDNNLWHEALKSKFLKDVDTRLLDMADSLGPDSFMQKYVDGEWVIETPVLTRIPKDGFDKVDMSNPKSYRELIICKPRDRILFAYINLMWNKIYGDQLSNNTYAYREGRSTRLAVQEVSKHNCDAYKLDMQKYFDSVNRDTINKALSELSIGPIDDVLRDFYNNEDLIVDGKLTKRFKSLGQGMATAAFLSNYVLRDIDELMARKCACYVRYSDDMILMDKDSKKLDEALHILVEELSKFSLSINDVKTKYITSGVSTKFLGYKLIRTESGYDIGIADEHVAKTMNAYKHSLNAKKIVKRFGKSSSKIIKDDKSLNAAIRYAVSFVYNTLDFRINSVYQDSIQRWDIITDYENLTKLDYYFRDRIRAAITDSNNVVRNKRIIPDELLFANGYRPLRELINLSRLSTALYKSARKDFYTRTEPIVSVEDCVVHKSVYAANALYSYLLEKVKYKENKTVVDLVRKQIKVDGVVVFDATKPCELEAVKPELFEDVESELFELFGRYYLVNYEDNGGNSFLFTPYTTDLNEAVDFPALIFHTMRIKLELYVFTAIVCDLLHISEWSGSYNNYAWLYTTRKIIFWRSWF